MGSKICENSNARFEDFQEKLSSFSQPRAKLCPGSAGGKWGSDVPHGILLLLCLGRLSRLYLPKDPLLSCSPPAAARFSSCSPASRQIAPPPLLLLWMESKILILP